MMGDKRLGRIYVNSMQICTEFLVSRTEALVSVTFLSMMMSAKFQRIKVTG